MFIERSAGRIRFARTVFVLAGLVPCAGLVAWAVHLRSASHRESLRAGWQRAVGVPLEVDAVEHPRPGVVRARGCRVVAPDGGRLTHSARRPGVAAAASFDHANEPTSTTQSLG